MLERHYYWIAITDFRSGAILWRDDQTGRDQAVYLLYSRKYLFHGLLSFSRAIQSEGI